MQIRPRILVVGSDEQVGYRLRQALEVEYDVRQTPSLDAPLDDPLQEADVALLDWSILNQVILKTTLENGEHDARQELALTEDLKAVAQLGTILKSLSASARGRRGRIVN
jgi:hypothetical protein